MKFTSIHSHITPYSACLGLMLRRNHNMKPQPVLCLLRQCDCLRFWCARTEVAVQVMRGAQCVAPCITCTAGTTGQAQLGWHCQDHPYSTQLSRVDWNTDPARAFHKAAAGDLCIILQLQTGIHGSAGRLSLQSTQGSCPTLFFPRIKGFFSLAEKCIFQPTWCLWTE